MPGKQKHYLKKDEVSLNSLQIKRLTPYLNDIEIPNHIKKNEDGSTKGKKRFITNQQRAFAWYYYFNGNNKADAYRRSKFFIKDMKTGLIVVDEEAVTQKKLERPGFNESQLGRELLSKPYIQEALRRIQKEVHAQELPRLMIEQMKVQATYNPFMFINPDGSPKFKTEEELYEKVPEEYHCCVKHIETRAYGKDADVRITTIKLVDREAVRKEIKELYPEYFKELPKEIMHTTIDKDGNKVGFDPKKFDTKDLEKILSIREIMEEDEEEDDG